MLAGLSSVWGLLGRICFLVLFQLLEAALACGPSSIFKTSRSIFQSLTLAHPASLLQDPCDSTELTQIIQDNLPVSRPLP